MNRNFFKIFLIFTLTFQIHHCEAQSTELGVLFGSSSYSGELNPHLITTDFSVYHPSAGLFLRRNWNSHYSFRLNAMYGTISGDDAHQSSAFAKSRNLSFSSPLFELAGLFEFNFFPYEKYGSPYKMTPFVFTGLGLFYFAPSAYIGGTKYNLADKKLEGVGYAPIQASLPLGVGIKARLGSWSLGMEVAPRKASTDYLDNVSNTYLDKISLKGASQTLANPSPDTAAVTIAGRQRGTAKDKDWYMFIGFTISHKIGSNRKHECDRLLRDQ